jgi:hypothetical protein
MQNPDLLARLEFRATPVRCTARWIEHRRWRVEGGGGTLLNSGQPVFLFCEGFQAANPCLVRGGAMNEGDTGSEMQRLRIASISAFVAASIC